MTGKEKPFDKGHQGLNVSPNPLAEEKVKGGVTPQKQEWPGREDKMQPRADHGEETYKGSGKLAGKKALITGGDSGIGKAVAIAFAREGADVAIVYLNENDDAQDTVRWIEKAGRKALSYARDLRERTHCLEVVERVVEEFGGLDILVNNAAYQSEIEDFLDLTEEQVDRTFKTNIYAYIWMAQAALPHMKEGASIINTGSVTGARGSPKLPDYAATKAAIANLTLSLAQLVAEKGIRVNCVAPGPVWTPLIPSTFNTEHTEKFGADTVWGRPAQPAEIAPTYVFLASADARFYTGEVFMPTGEILAKAA